MKKILSYLLVCMTLLCFVPKEAMATHAAGAELLYEWVSDSTYRLYYKFYRDCVGTTEPISVDVCYWNSCTTYSNTVTLTKLTTLPNGEPNGSEVTTECPGSHTTCTQPSSTTPGYQEWWYTGTVTLPSRCNHWTFAYGINARNNAITNLTDPGNTYLYVEATLDNLDAQGDTSPEFSVKPVPYVCINVPYVYNNGAYDINNDSLYFEIINPLTGYCSGGTPSATPTNIQLKQPTGIGNDTDNYNLTNNPLACNYTFSLNSSDGNMSFTPSEIQRAVVSLRVSEYRNGIKIGSVMRDIQIVVMNCDNPQPNVNIDQSTVTGGNLDSTGTITACANEPLNFCFEATSADSTAVLEVTDNSSTVLNGSSLSYTNQGTDSVQGCLSWTPAPTDTGLKIFTVSVKDSTCRPPAGIITTQTYTIPIRILPETTILKDTAICQGASIPLQVIGGSNFVWNVLPGGSPISSMSCTSCANPTVSPTVTTKYIVTATNNSSCKNKDTVTITVIPPIGLNLVADTTTCVNDSLQLDIHLNPSPGTTYHVSWTPATYLNNDTISNPVTKPINDITYSVLVTADGVNQCSAADTVTVHVLQGFKVFNGDTAICKGQAVPVTASGDFRYNYQWTPTLNVSNPNSLSPTITPDTSGTYTVTASFPGCTDSMQSFFIDVQPNPVVIAGADRVICAGDTAHLNASVTPPYNYTYDWSPGGSLDTTNITNPIFNGLQTTTLTVSATTSAGCNSADSLTISVIKVQFLHISSDTAICPGDTATLHIRGDSLASFYWSPNLFINDTVNANPEVWPVASTQYTVYGFDSTNCRDTASVYVTVHPAAVLDLPDSVTIYPGDSYQMNPQGNCLYYTWFPPLGLSATDISNPIATPDVNTKYIVNAQTEAGCKTMDTIDVYVSLDSYIAVPNAFTPGTGPNALLKVLHLGDATLNRFSIYNRWGVKVFESSDINEGWDGTYNGQPQPMGVYVYIVDATSHAGRHVYKQGNVTLLR